MAIKPRDRPGEADPDRFDLDSDGFSPSRLAGMNTIAVNFYEKGNLKKATRLLDVDQETGELHYQAVHLLVRAMCHAANAGVTPGEFREIVDRFSSEVETHPPFDREGLLVEGLLYTRLPSVQYIMRYEDDLDQVIVVQPANGVEVMTVAELVKQHRQSHV